MSGDPGEPGFSEPGFIKRLLNWGMNFIYTTGQVGLQLFNALRRRWPGASREQLSRWSRFLGSSAREGVRLTGLGNDDPLQVQQFPLVGGSVWDEEPGARWRVTALIEGIDQRTGRTEYRTVNVFGVNEITGQDLDELALTLNQEWNDRYSSGGAGTPIEPSSIKYTSAIARY